MGDWCGSAQADNTDTSMTEATGAEKGKTAVGESVANCKGQAKTVVIFVRGGVSSLDPPFNGRPHLPNLFLLGHEKDPDIQVRLVNICQ
jgi:hypothetical protein